MFRSVGRTTVYVRAGDPGNPVTTGGSASVTMTRTSHDARLDDGSSATYVILEIL